MAEAVLSSETLRDGHKETFSRYGISEADEHLLSIISQPQSAPECRPFQGRLNCANRLKKLPYFVGVSYGIWHQGPNVMFQVLTDKELCSCYVTTRLGTGHPVYVRV